GEPECGGADSYSCLLALRLNGLPHSALTYNDRPLFDTSGFSRDGLSRESPSRLKPFLRKAACATTPDVDARILKAGMCDASRTWSLAIRPLAAERKQPSSCSRIAAQT
ncbi:hypothetical protein, partial [Xanthomonas sacchari]|uniref:hypothetical protein n=1 Tax=Xanthomonas sacchari TaxID=56458 RepID=UPI0022557F3C